VLVNLQRAVSHVQVLRWWSQLLYVRSARREQQVLMTLCDSCAVVSS